MTEVDKGPWFCGEPAMGLAVNSSFEENPSFPSELGSAFFLSAVFIFSQM